jgi:hypothetical protein
MVDFDGVTVKATHATMVRERRKRMDSSQIEQYLGFLGQKLADMQVTTSLILLGGALMITQIGNRKATQDIDVVIATNDRRTYQFNRQLPWLRKKRSFLLLGSMMMSPLSSIKSANQKHRNCGKSSAISPFMFPNWSIFSHSSFFQGVLKMIATSRQ